MAREITYNNFEISLFMPKYLYKSCYYLYKYVTKTTPKNEKYEKLEEATFRSKARWIKKG